jgi:ribose-phosphate pyrophosphokinase
MRELISQSNVIVLKKKRDFETGKIQGLEIESLTMRGAIGVEDTAGTSKALIIDDLSSRGGTFVGAADLLRTHGFDKVALLVTHMEPAGLLGDLRHKLDRVFCTDTMTFPRPVPANFEVFQRSAWT